MQQILLKVDAWREEQDVYYVYVFYNRHIGARTYRPTAIELLPINLHRFHRLRAEPWPSKNLPSFTMTPNALLRRLLRQYLFASIARACAESQAREHASRLAAMQAAERNLDERLTDLTARYRRARQTIITSELLDVIGGFEALTNVH